MSDITWGPEIAVDGKRPEWLEDDTSFLAIFDDGFEWKEPYQAAQIQAWRQEGEGFVKSIRLPADHPHYATLSHPTAPIPSEVGPEVVEITKITQEEAEARGELCGFGSMGRQGYVQCLRDLGLILPEPVDPVETIARRLIDQHDEPWPGGTESDRLHYWRDKAIQAANDLRALAAGDR